MIIDKQNRGCAFKEESHKYWNLETGEFYTSVTTLIGKYHEKFNGDFWAKYKACERIATENKKFNAWKEFKKALLNTKVWSDSYYDTHVKAIGSNSLEVQDVTNDINEEWDKTRDDACERGTDFHLAEEYKFYEYPIHNLDFLNVPGLGGDFHCEKGCQDLSKYERGIFPEYLVSAELKDPSNPNVKLMVAGQVDLLIRDGKDIYILDYKTNKKIDQKSYYDWKVGKSVRMLHPLGHLDDCNYVHYNLQLSMYAFLLEKLHGFNVKHLRIIHYDHDGNIEPYDFKYLKNEVIAVLKHYRNQMYLSKLDEFLDI